MALVAGSDADFDKKTHDMIESIGGFRKRKIRSAIRNVCTSHFFEVMVYYDAQGEQLLALNGELLGAQCLKDQRQRLQCTFFVCCCNVRGN